MKSALYAFLLSILVALASAPAGAQSTTLKPMMDIGPKRTMSLFFEQIGATPGRGRADGRPLVIINNIHSVRVKRADM